MLFKDFCIYSYGGHFVQSNGIILANIETGYKRNISVKLF